MRQSSLATHSRVLRLIAICLLCGLWTTIADEAHADDMPRRLTSMDANADARFIGEELRRIELDLEILRAADTAFADLAVLPNEIREAYSDRLERHLRNIISTLAPLLDARPAALSRQQSFWSEGQDYVGELQRRVAECHAERWLLDPAGNWHVQGWLTHWYPIFLSLLLFWTAVAVACRRWLRMLSHRRGILPQIGAVVLCLAVSLLPLGAGLWGSRISADESVSPRPVLTTAETSISDAVSDLRLDTGRLQDAWDRLGEAQPLLRPSLRQLWQEFRLRLGEYQRKEETILELEREIVDLQSQRVALTDRLVAQHAASLTCQIWASGTSLLLWSVFLLAIAVHKTRVRWQCAKCGYWGKQVRIGGKEVSELRCQADWNLLVRQGNLPGVGTATADSTASEPPKGSATSSEANRPAVTSRRGSKVCGFTIEARRMGLKKLYVPLVGRSQVGKTLWLAAAYQSILFSQYDSNLELTRLKMGGLGPDQQDMLDEILEQIKRNGPNAVSASTADLPEPVIFRFEDRDALCRSGALVTVADFAGEVMTHYPTQHPLRRRMLIADAIMLFIQLQTPNKSKEENTEAAWAQIEAINTFVAQTAAGSRTAPVAVCVSKLDELMTASRDQKGDEQEFLKELARLERERAPGRHRAELIQARHVLTQELVRALWPGDLSRELDKLTGRHFCFFPVTSFGFNRPADPNPESHRPPGPIKPWGELEPLLWILQMHGFATFPRGQTT